MDITGRLAELAATNDVKPDVREAAVKEKVIQHYLKETEGWKKLALRMGAVIGANIQPRGLLPLEVVRIEELVRQAVDSGEIVDDASAGRVCAEIQMRIQVSRYC